MESWFMAMRLGDYPLRGGVSTRADGDDEIPGWPENYGRENGEGGWWRVDWLLKVWGGTPQWRA